jgi:hypothetical protein
MCSFKGDDSRGESWDQCHTLQEGVMSVLYTVFPNDWVMTHVGVAGDLNWVAK